MPTIFVSSTIRDLADLRSAVRYFMSEHGFEVLSSETADFPHNLTGEAWRAALAPLDLADYFVLIVGHRAGWITPTGLSVTHVEFRRARELSRTSGRPLIVVLARQRVLDAYRGGEKPGQADNWEAVQSLLDEASTATHDADTTWIHGFTSFDDVATVLRTSLKLTGPLKKRVLEAGLIEEFYSNGERLLRRSRDAVVPGSRILLRVPKDAGALVDRSLTTIIAFRLGLPAPGALGTVALQDAISSGEFTQFEPAAGRVVAGPVQHALLRVRQRIARYETLLSLLSSGPYVREFAALTPNGGSRPPSQEFVDVLWAIRDELENIEVLTQALARHVLALDAEWADPPLNAPTPDPVEAARIAAESVTRSDVDRWLGVT
jgi:hypothetical protein